MISFFVTVTYTPGITFELARLLASRHARDRARVFTIRLNKCILLVVTSARHCPKLHFAQLF